MSYPYVITIWHASFYQLSEFANQHALGDNLVSVVRDVSSESVHATYRVDHDMLIMLRSIPYLSWK